MKQTFDWLVSHAEFKEVELVSLMCSQNKQLVDSLGNVHISIDYTSLEMVQDGYEWMFPVRFCIRAYHGEQGDPPPEENHLFCIEFVLDCIYSLDIEEECSTSHPKKIDQSLPEQQVLSNVWPYARELVSNLTIRMGFPPLMIPPLKQAT
ncbi:protein-export chaperone SecB [Hazenella coriacea]|nr:protein-export chaperone SecB [Hazenella coriacea]